MTDSKCLDVPVGPLRLMFVVLAFVIAGCSERATCGVQLTNEAAGIGSMQKLVVRLEGHLSKHSHVDLLDSPEHGLVALRLVSAQLDRLPDGEQSSVGRFRYEVDASGTPIKGECEGALKACAEEIANVVLESCPST